MSAEARFGEVLRALAAEVASSAKRVAASAKGTVDPEAVHDFRVALRKLRTLLRPARDVFGKRRARTAAAALRSFAQVTGAVRDDEVLVETLASLRLGAPARAALTAWGARRAKLERSRRRSALAMVADEARLAMVLGEIEAIVARPKRAREGADVARGALARAARDVEALRSSLDATASAASLHELRILYKRLRYTAEAFAAEVGPTAEAIAKRATKMQKRLGEVHDLDVARARILRARSLPVATRRAVLGAVARARRELVARFAAEILVIR